MANGPNIFQMLLVFSNAMKLMIRMSGNADVLGIARSVLRLYGCFCSRLLCGRNVRLLTC